MDEEQSRHFVEISIARHKQIDVAVLTVGGFAMGSIDETPIGDINQQIRLNFETAYNIARPVFQQMMQQKQGRIFLVGSKPGSDMRNSKGMVAYGLAKSLIFRLAELLNGEAKNTDVVTSVIVPSTIDTPQNRKSMPGADPSKWVKPEAIADAIFFYCSPEGAALREPVIKAYGLS
jgi:NAD(P)-dependent dehydrogenase (short-subunit alcohol dehydrogenase family)